MMIQTDWKQPRNGTGDRIKRQRGIKTIITHTSHMYKKLAEIISVLCRNMNYTFF